MPSGPRTAAADVQIRLGLAGTRGKLVPIRKSEKSGFVTLCPECSTPNRVRQSYSCPDGHGPFGVADCIKGKEVDDKIVALNADEIAALSLETNTNLDLRVHPSDQVEAQTAPNGAAYRFVPAQEVDPFYGVLADLVDEPDLAFIGFVTTRGKQKLFRLVRKPQGLVLVELCRPEEMWEFDEITVAYDARYLEMAVKIVEGELADFDPDEYKDGRVEKIAEIVASKTGDEIAPVPSKTATPSTTSLEEALLASLGQAS